MSGNQQEALISVIIPVYNVEAYIAECIESVMQQTFPHLEIICVDDGSTDASADIIRRFALQDARITLIHNERNMGPSGARNAGINRSKAPFIMFLDSDDSYTPDMCKKLYGAVTSSGADLAMCDIRITYEADESFKKSDDSYYTLKFEGVQPVDDAIVGGCDVSVWNKIFRRELLNRYDIRFPEGLAYEDAYFFNAYLAQSRTMAFVNEKLYHYRRRVGSIMNKTFSKGGMSIDHLKIAMRLHEYYVKWQLLDKKYPYFCHLFLQYLDLAIRFSPNQKSKENILRMATKFARENLRDTSTLPAYIAQRIELCKGMFTKRARAFLFRIKMQSFSKSYTLAGIPYYTIRYSPSCKKHYLCGIQVCRTAYASRSRF